MDAAGRRQKVKGDISKIHQIIGLSATEQALLRNYNVMSSRIAGTRQIRNSIRHMVFSSRVFYGIPVFMTFTPSERHSGLAIRLSRGRRRDPAYTGSAHDLRPWIGYDTPSLSPTNGCSDEGDVATVELPEYDTRRLLTARDPLCCVYAWLVTARVVFPTLYGFRMCPQCPHCATGADPCMDVFGSNATPMGGSAGRADGMIGAVEAQKAEGVLHIHLFLYIQMVAQYSTLLDLAHMLQTKLVPATALKLYESYVRCAAYPDVARFEKERDDIEKAWPAYAADPTLSRLPHFFWHGVDATGDEWCTQYADRLQHALSRMNHRIHPRADPSSEERRSLDSCRPKSAAGKGKNAQSD